MLAPHGLVESFRAQAARGLQIESLGAQLLVAADHLGLYSVTVAHHTRGAVTYDVRGSLPQALGALSSALQVVAVLGVAWLYGRGRDDGRRLVGAFAAAVAGFLAFTRFFSPQYLVWLVPFVPLLSQGWALLGAHRVRLHPALDGIDRTMRDSLWSLFDARGIEKLRRAMETKEVR